jgi:hypothetical protein
LIIYKSLFHDYNNPSYTQRLLEIDLLETYLNREKDEVVNLNYDIWNDSTICQLLKDSYPKKNNINNLDTFMSRAGQIPPTYNFANPRLEQDFVGKVLTLLHEVGEKNISLNSQTLLVTAWMKLWS